MMVTFIDCFIILFIISVAMTTNEFGKPVIILAAVKQDDSYYGQYFDTIAEFQANFVNQALGKDNIIIAVPNNRTKQLYIQKGVPESVLIDFAFSDIWLRDPSPVNMKHQTMFYYDNQYQSTRENQRIQQRIRQAITQACQQCANSCSLSDIQQVSIALDGGNVVDNYVDKAIITNRVLKDNKRLSTQQILSTIKSYTGYSKVALVPDLGDTTGHSDGMVAFLDENHIGITTTMYPDEIDKVKNAIRNEFGNINFVHLNSHYEEEYFRGFDSACGLHVNMLLTQNYLYVPVFGNDPKNRERGQSTQLDDAVLNAIRTNTNRHVVPIDVPHDVCIMGGSVRCLTWSIGAGPLADCFTQWENKNQL